MSSLDRILGVLSDHRRRHIIYLLEERAGPIPVEELAGHLADHDEPTEPESSDQRAQLKIELRHNHLPKLADEDFIQYDPNEGHAELATLPPAANKLLAVTKDIDRPHDAHE